MLDDPFRDLAHVFVELWTNPAFGLGLSEGLLDSQQLNVAAARLAADDLDHRSESGIESLVRVALRDSGLHVASQVVVPGVGRVDLLVEGRVIVEVDGRRWHAGEQARDYWRDLELARRGYAVVRVDYRLVVSRLDAVVAAVLRASSRAIPVGVHLLRSSGVG